MAIRAKGNAILEGVWSAVSFGRDVMALQTRVLSLLAKSAVSLACDERLNTHFQWDWHDRFCLTLKMSHEWGWRDSWLCTRRDSPARWLWRLVRPHGRYGNDRAEKRNSRLEYHGTPTFPKITSFREITAPWKSLSSLAATSKSQLTLHCGRRCEPFTWATKATVEKAELPTA